MPKFKPPTRLYVAANMPPLFHSHPDRKPGEYLDPANSKAIDWLCAQPEIRGFLWSKVISLNLIEFDKATGTWRGRNVDAPKWEF